MYEEPNFCAYFPHRGLTIKTIKPINRLFRARVDTSTHFTIQTMNIIKHRGSYGLFSGDKSCVLCHVAAPDAPYTMHASVRTHSWPTAAWARALCACNASRSRSTLLDAFVAILLFACFGYFAWYSCCCMQSIYWLLCTLYLLIEIQRAKGSRFKVCIHTTSKIKICDTGFLKVIHRIVGDEVILPTRSAL